MTASDAAFTVFSGFGLVLSVIPLWWHLQSLNVGTCMFMIWTALACLVHFVDSIVWSGNAINWAPVWCDIVIRVQIGVSVAWPACSLCIIRRLYYITCTVPTAQTEKRRGVIIDLLITVGIPVLQMAIEYTVAGHRFNIFEDFGCFPATYNNTLAYVLVWSWPLIIGIISACYGALTIRAFIMRRKAFEDLISTDACLTYSRYWRLIALASVDYCFTIPISLRVIVVGLSTDVQPWVSWDDTHFGYSRIVQMPRILLDQNSTLRYSLEITRWTAILCAFVFFGFFGFTSEARRNYHLLASMFANSLGFTLSIKSASAPGSPIVDHSLHFALPVSTTQQTVSRRDSDSFSDQSLARSDSGFPSHCPAKQLTPTNSMAIYEVPRFPESLIYPVVGRRLFVPGVSARVHLGDTLDWV